MSQHCPYPLSSQPRTARTKCNEVGFCELLLCAHVLECRGDHDCIET